MARRLSRRSLALYLADKLTTSSADTAVQQLAAYLVESRRTKEIDLIVRDAEYIMAQRGVVGATVTSAFELSAETKATIEKMITTQMSAESVEIKNEIDPSVIGGVKISVPGYELDQTIAHQLTVLKTRFKKA